MQEVQEAFAMWCDCWAYHMKMLSSCGVPCTPTVQCRQQRHACSTDLRISNAALLRSSECAGRMKGEVGGSRECCVRLRCDEADRSAVDADRATTDGGQE